MINQRGEVILLVILVLAIIMVTTLLLIGGAQVYHKSAVYSAEAEKATALAEAGIDKAVESLNKTGGSYTGEIETNFGDGSYSVEITSKAAATKIVKATGYLPNKTSPKVKRTVQIEASKGTGVSFKYGVQVGEGGFELGNDNTIKGTIYSNGNIIAGNNNIIEGDAWVAGGPQPNPNQETDCAGVNCQPFDFGKNVGGENRLDIAQSFKPSQGNILTKVSIKVKKFGNPTSDPMVRILKDAGGSPDKDQVLATGTLFNNLLTSAFCCFIDVAFNANPSLNAGETYWLMIDTCGTQTNCNSSDYWSWQNDLAASYTDGGPKWSPRWNAGSPTWTAFAGDLSFKIYLGGVATKISTGNNTRVKKDVHAHTIEGTTVDGKAYYQTITNSNVGGSPCPNANCFPGSPDSPPGIFPISDANILQWQQDAETANPSLNAPVCGLALPWGPGKYNGSLTLGNSCTITVKTPIWITDNLTMGNSNTFTLSSDYGLTSGVIIVDGLSDLGNTNRLLGTGLGSSLLMLLSTYDSRSNNVESINIGNVGNTGVFYAGKGIVDPGNSNQFKELTAWKIKITNLSVIDYESGLASSLFSSCQGCPGGAYSLVKGTYQVK